MSAETRQENLEESDRQQHRHESDQEVSDALMLLFRLPDEAIASIVHTATTLTRAALPDAAGAPH